VLRTGWPLYALLYGYPVWWLLGFAVFAWLLLAVPAAAWLWGRRRVVTPPGFGTWALFLGWMMLSGTQLAAVDDLRSFSLRAAVYVSAGVYFLFVFNLPAGHDRRIENALLAFFAFVIGAGLVAMTLSVSEFVTPLERLLPQSISSIPFLNQMIHGQVSQVHTFLGFPVTRPAAPFAFTNEWGAAVGILAPVAFHAARTQPRGWRRSVALAVLVAALVPVVYSLNRGLWLSLAAAAVYVTARLAIHGRTRPLMNILGAATVIVVLVIATPLGSLAAERLDTGHSDDRRTDLVAQSVSSIAAAPVLGHGGPQIDLESPDRAPIGTHGQLWLVGVSHGVPGIVFYVGTLLLILGKSRDGGPETPAFWANAAVFVALFQLPFYSHVPVQIQLILVLGAVALRHRARVHAGPEPAVTRTG
jgi:hypothetical protein